MKDLQRVNNPFGEQKLISQCSIFGMMDTSGRRRSGKDVITAIANMHDRGNGLGGGFAAYGIYPERADDYALHVMFDTREARQEGEKYLSRFFHVRHGEQVPFFKTPGIRDAPDLWRYFCQPRMEEEREILSEDEFIVKRVMEINSKLDGAYVFSSGKNMGVFKGVGFPEQIAEYFGLTGYEGYIWTAHGRFPTNSQAWWGGAHPFSMLEYSVVHNGELSSYGSNRRFLEMYGYLCTMHTDTEVLAYAVDLLARRHGLPIETVMDVFSPPIWEQIDRLEPKAREYFTTLRTVYGPLLMNGPFAIIVASHGEMVAHTDRVRLRPMVAGQNGDVLYVSSEEASIRLVSPRLDRVWIPVGGHPVIGRLKKVAKDAEVVSGGYELTQQAGMED
jgi:glutamate synthase domain-containing protein 1